MTGEFTFFARLIYHRKQPLIGYAPVYIVDFERRIIRRSGQCRRRAAPIHQRLNRAFPVLPNEPVRFDQSLDRALDLVRFFFDFSRVGSQADERKTE